MYKTIVTIETITPMFSSGENKSEAEFRITELKALLRSTFREFFEYKDIDELKEKEDFLFGSTKKKSPVIVLNSNVIKIENREMLLHKKYPIEVNFIENGSKIELIFRSKDKDKNLLDLWIKILQLSSWTGGLGKQSRKGMGAFKILEIKDNERNKVKLFDSLENIFNELKERTTFIDKEKEFYYRIRNFEKKGNATKSDKVTEFETDILLNKINSNYVKKITIIKTKFHENIKLKNSIFYKISSLTHKRMQSNEISFKFEENLKETNNSVITNYKIRVIRKPLSYNGKPNNSNGITIKGQPISIIETRKIKKENSKKAYVYIDESTESIKETDITVNNKNIKNIKNINISCSFKEKDIIKEYYNKDILGNCKETLSRFASPVYITVYEFDSEQYLIIKELNYDYIYGNKLKKQSGDEKYIQWYIDEIKKIALEAE